MGVNIVIERFIFMTMVLIESGKKNKQTNKKTEKPRSLKTNGPV